MTDDQTPFAYGAIYGTRAWCIDRAGYLTGVIYKQRWTPGENLATCRNVRRDMVDHVTGRSFTTHNGIPDDHPGYPIEPGHMVECSNGRIGIAGTTGRAAGFGGCGFHAYLQGSNDYKNSGDASGVVALYGRGVVGTLGGRFMKARIVALFLPRTLAEAMDDDQHRYYSPRMSEAALDKADALIRANYAAVRDHYRGIPFYDSWDDMLRAHPTTPPALKEKP